LEGDDIYAAIGERPAERSQRAGAVFYVDGEFCDFGHLPTSIWFFLSGKKCYAQSSSGSKSLRKISSRLSPKRLLRSWRRTAIVVGDHLAGDAPSAAIFGQYPRAVGFSHRHLSSVQGLVAECCVVTGCQRHVWAQESDPGIFP